MNSNSIGPKLRLPAAFAVCIIVADALGKEREEGSALVVAAFEGDLGETLRLLEAGSRIDEPYNGPSTAFADDSGGYPAFGGNWTALHAAVASGQDSLAAYLIGRGANVNTPGVRGYTPLYLVADRRELDANGLALAHLLILHGAAIDKQTELSIFASHGQSPLHRAERRGHTHLVKALVAAGASDDLRDVRGRRPSDMRRKRLGNVDGE